MYLVTGGAGFIGSAIVRLLIDNGEPVRVIDNLSTGNLAKLDGYLEKIEFIKDDITVAGEEVYKGVHTIFHQAAIASVERSVSNPAATEHVNVYGTVNLLMQASACGVKRVVSAGSAAVYGDPVTVFNNNSDSSACVEYSNGIDLQNEKIINKNRNISADSGTSISEETAISPLTPYAFSKYAVEFYSKMFALMYGLETVVLRYFNVFGPFQDPGSDYSGVISKFAALMLDDDRPLINGDGEQTRDFVYVDDVAAANLLAGKSINVGRGETINIGCGNSVSVKELVAVVNTVLGKDIQPLYGDARSGDVRYSLANISKARKLLGYEPKVSFSEGLAITMEWLKKSNQ